MSFPAGAAAVRSPDIPPDRAEVGLVEGLLPETFSVAACNSSGAKSYSLSMEKDEVARRGEASSGTLLRW